MTAERTYKVEGLDFLVEIADESASDEVPACNFVDSITLQEVLFQNLIRPDTECSGVLGVDAIAHRKNGIKIIELSFCRLSLPN